MSVATGRRNGRPLSERILDKGGRGFVIAMAVVWLVPLWLMLVTPMKTLEEYADGSQWTLPENPLTLLDNISTAWSSAGLGPGFLASLGYGLAGGSLAILCGSLGAYAVTRLPVRGRFFWFMLVFSGTIFPFQMYLIPLYRRYIEWGLYDTHAGMVLFYAAIATPFCLFVMRGFFSTIEPELEDAARIDGATRWQIFWRIFMRLAPGPIAVLLLFQFTWIWNDLLFGLVLSTSDGVRPVMAALYGMQGMQSTTGPPVVIAGALIGSLPTLILFLLLGRYLIRGLALTTNTREDGR